MEATLTHYENECSVTRPVRSTSASTFPTTSLISTYRFTNKKTTKQAYKSTVTFTTPKLTSIAPLKTTSDATTSVLTSSVFVGTTYPATTTILPLGTHLNMILKMLIIS